MEHYSLQGQSVVGRVLNVNTLLEKEAENKKWRAETDDHILKTGLLSDFSELLICLWDNI